MQSQTNNALAAAIGNDAATAELRGILEWVDGVGQRFYVSSLTGSSSYNGRKPTSPKATIAQALALCTAGAGDRIYVLPGHTETVTGAAGIALSKAGVYIIGLGLGSLRPTINYTTAAAASVDITAANVWIENIKFDMTGVDAVTAGINIQAADVTLKNLEIEFADSGGQATLAILTTAAANRLKIEGCRLFGSADAGTATAIRIVGGNDIRILDTVIIGNFTTSLGGIENNTTACLRLLIAGCTILNNTASSTKCIVLDSGTTGAVVRCQLAILSGTAPITGAALNVVGQNYYKAAAGVAAGTLI